MPFAVPVKIVLSFNNGNKRVTPGVCKGRGSTFFSVLLLFYALLCIIMYCEFIYYLCLCIRII